jgi:hypothetical protein
VVGDRDPTFTHQPAQATVAISGLTGRYERSYQRGGRRSVFVLHSTTTAAEPHRLSRRERHLMAGAWQMEFRLALGRCEGGAGLAAPNTARPPP